MWLYLDAFFKGWSDDDPVDIDAGHVDVIRVKATNGDNLFHFSNGDLGCTRHRRIEVASSFAKHQVASFVSLPCLRGVGSTSRAWHAKQTSVGCTRISE